MRIIAIEEHFTTPAVQEAAGGGGQSDKFAEPLLELGEGRLRRMDEAGVDVAVLSLSSPGTQTLSAQEAVPLARESNDVLAEAVRQHPERFLGFATLPTPDPYAAADELRRSVRELGFLGAMVNGRTEDKFLDHPDFTPVFEAAVELDVPIYIHPQVPSDAVRAAYYDGFEPELSAMFAASGWGWHVETAIHALRMILAGVFDRLPELQIILGHWGELLPFYLERIDRMSSAADHLERPVAEYFRTNVHITPGGILSVPMLLHAMETVGPDRILFAVDDPFVPMEGGAGRKFLENAPIAPADREKIAFGNAEKLLKISAG